MLTIKGKKYGVTIIIALMFFVAISYSIILFNGTVNQELEASVKSTLSDMADQQQVSLNRQLESMIYGITSVAETLPIIGVDEAGILEYVAEKQVALNYETVLIADNQGMAFWTDGGKLVDISQEIYFKEAHAGDIYASEPYMSELSNKQVIALSAPIYVEGKVDGVLAVEYCTTYLGSLLTSFTDSRGLNLVINDKSEIVITTNEFVLSFDAFKNAIFDDGVTFEGVLEDFMAGNSGGISYVLNGDRKFGEYRPLEVNNWMLFFEISEESISKSADKISSNMLTISAVTIFCAFLVIAYVIYSKNKSEEVLERAAYYDELTGIPNVLKLKQHIAETLDANKDKKYVIVKLDVVNFKAINEMFGYDVGNRVIMAIADTGKTVKEKSFIQARVSNEEFMLFADASFFNDLESSSKIYEKLFKTLVPELVDHQFTFRYGRYYIEQGELDVNSIVNKVNTAHSLAKKDSSKNIWDYDEQYTKKVLRDTEIANKMHKALEMGEFKVYLQPKYNINTGKISGAEALVRWFEDNGGVVYPNEFIPLFEQNGFIVELDMYMLKNVCASIANWKEKSGYCLPVSVNFSRLHINNPNFLRDITEIVRSQGVDPSCIEIELTETTVMDNETELRVLLKEVHELGFRVSIDDFGSGYSSLGMLKNFKVDTLKLDRSFFIEIEDDEEQQRGNLVVESVIDLARCLGMTTVAEGIEDPAQVNFLKKIECDAAQGYFYARPMPTEDFEKLYFEQL